MKLPSLLYRHRRGDLIFLFKMLNNYFNLDHSYFFTFSHNTQTRGHAYKLLKPPAHLSCRVNYFITRVINDWNNLTSDIVGYSLLNVTGFDKTRLPHTSNSSTLTSCSLATKYAIDLQFSQNSFTAWCNNCS